MCFKTTLYIKLRRNWQLLITKKWSCVYLYYAYRISGFIFIQVLHRLPFMTRMWRQGRRFGFSIHVERSPFQSPRVELRQSRFDAGDIARTVTLLARSSRAAPRVVASRTSSWWQWRNISVLLQVSRDRKYRVVIRIADSIARDTLWQYHGFPTLHDDDPFAPSQHCGVPPHRDEHENSAHEAH